ncbi:LON peptidase substrate-binding domain-containing protein [Roseivirga misakiensis]|uniref:Lon N-terminal domain-containing protein n=1 Tax=Roseivirga misakiensis TaxID=1563681 RepID=A0A1E5T562_9BACT|nr:LON peptidase substrate-binding domain-containing protein [Roseivirga misakiensis]OEK06467.1 hypothetical protein BFP71_01965 [Roseivirga misakiensis]
MAKRYLPFFPLKLVAFPGEQLNLHVFEPRYKQLINECVDEGKTFGIPVFEKGMKEFGGEMEVTEVVKTYATGEMDISTRCIGTIQIFSFDEKAPGKLYAGGNVESIENFQDATIDQWMELKHLAKQLISILKMDDKLDIELLSSSFELAHKLGLSLEQEYDMLQMTRESQRQAYMINHLERALPLIREMEGAKNRIKMNGHFQHHDPLNF